MKKSSCKTVKTVLNQQYIVQLCSVVLLLNQTYAAVGSCNQNRIRDLGSVTTCLLFPIQLCICFTVFQFSFHISPIFAFFKTKIGRWRQKSCLLGAYYRVAVKLIRVLETIKQLIQINTQGHIVKLSFVSCGFQWLPLGFQIRLLDK